MVHKVAVGRNVRRLLLLLGRHRRDWHLVRVGNLRGMSPVVLGRLGKIRGKVRIGGTLVVAIVVAGSGAATAVISVRRDGLQVRVRRGRASAGWVRLAGLLLHWRGEILQRAFAMRGCLLETLGRATARFVVFVRDGPPGRRTPIITIKNCNSNFKNVKNKVKNFKNIQNLKKLKKNKNVLYKLKKKTKSFVKKIKKIKISKMLRIFILIQNF